MITAQTVLAPAVGALRVVVRHLPAPQGSKRPVIRGGRAFLVDDNPATKGFRDAVTDAALEARRIAGHVTFTGPVQVTASFTLPRPRGHYGTGGNTHRLRPGAPKWPATKPDTDKLLRAVLDGLTDAQVFRDDALVVFASALKTYPGGGGLALDHPGALLLISEAT